MGVFTILPPEQALPVAELSFSVNDRYQQVMDGTLIGPVQSPAARVVDSIAWFVAGAGALDWPVITSTNTHVADPVLMKGTRHDAVVELASSIGVEVFFDRFGQCVIADSRVVGAATSEASTGVGGTVTGLKVTPEWDKVYNVVAASSSAQGIDFPPVSVFVSEPGHPAYPGRIRTKIYEYKSPLIMDEDQAQQAAVTILRKVSGLAEVTSYTCVPDPRRDAGDSMLGATIDGSKVTQIQTVVTPLGADQPQQVTTVNTQVAV
jgi:hypothetical protein